MATPYEENRISTPSTPTDVRLFLTATLGRVLVKWRMSGNVVADSVEISWSDNQNAWASGTGLSIQRIGRAEETFINDLESGKTWHVRVRFFYQGQVGPYSAIQSLSIPEVQASYPTNVILMPTQTLGQIRVAWQMNPNVIADSVEISWADKQTAWYSTEQPSTYIIDRRASNWLIEGLETGKTWYVRVRFIYNGSEGAYSAVKGIGLPGRVASVPRNVALSTTQVEGQIKVAWDMDAAIIADSIEISWSDSSSAWSSTTGPSTYIIDSRKSNWLIDGLETGKTWYVRVRFKVDNVFGVYSPIKSIKLAGKVPSTPTNVALSTTQTEGRVKVTWDMTSAVIADSVEISWADNQSAWSSTQGPSIYTIDRRAATWLIDNLTTGKTWYVRVRFILGDKKGAYSTTNSVALPGSTPVAPTHPTVTATETVGRVKAGWDWNWKGADSVEVSWSDNAAAWSSTTGYKSATTSGKTTYWFIDGLTTGKVWYFRYRFKYNNNTGPWSERISINLPATVKKVATQRPSGLTASRDGNKVNYTWKITDENYGAAQWIGFKYSGTDWQYTEIGKTATSCARTVPVANYYPNTNTKLTQSWVAVRGKRSDYTKVVKTAYGENTTKYYPQMSEWTIKETTYLRPYQPTVETELDEDNATIFKWSTSTSNTDQRPFTDCEWQSILVRECNETSGSKLGWKTSALGWLTGKGTASGTKRIVEDTEILAQGSYTRWFRVRSRGWAGDSEWKYAKHVYAIPKAAVISSYSAKKSQAGGYTAYVKWAATANASHPIDNSTIEYALVTPAAGQTFPTGESWIIAGTSYDTAGADAKTWYIDDALGVDECLFYRVNTHHDGNTTNGTPKLVLAGNLADPTDISVRMPTSGYSPTITATNNSQVPDSFLVVVYRRQGKKDMIVGVIPHGESSVTVTCPNWSSETAISFGVYAAQGTYKRAVRTDNVTQYTVTSNMISQGTIWGEGDVPKAPASVTLSQAGFGTLKVDWAWSWANANTAEISWADTEDAWESTAEPETYTIDQKTTSWYIADIEMGKKWYVRVRLINEEVVGPWSNITTIDLASQPVKPILVVSDGVITEEGNVTCSWTYACDDGTPQVFGEICMATIAGGSITYGDFVGHTETSQSLIIWAENVGWETGQEYSLCARTTSGSGRISEWSDPVTVRIAEPLTATIAATSLDEVEVPDDESEGTTRIVTALTEMPLTLTITGAGAGGTTSVQIVRAESYHMDRPDEDIFNGYEGEAVAVYSQTGEETFSIGVTDLIGLIDDGAKYKIVATVMDGLGQIASAEEEFEVHWSHQAMMPQGSCEIDSESYIAKITPIAPDEVEEGDYCDIYRLSVDKPELIVSGGIFGETYVDPYPTIGACGGHRIVFRTVNGDYITDDNQTAWIDLTEEDGDVLELDKTIIDFGGRRVLLAWNMEISSNWAKNFTETHYLGGAVQGDWNASVRRTGSVGAVMVPAEEQELIQEMRRLAVYPGICHVRTPEGSSYAANVDVSEDMSHATGAKIANFNVSITRVDPEGYDGVLLSEWESGVE